MNTANSSPKFRHLGLLLGALLATPAYPDLTNLSPTPLPTYSPTSGTDVKPNILFVLDDSGSMDDDTMPDGALLRDDTQFYGSSIDYSVSNYTGGSTFAGGAPNYLRYAVGFNGLAYNPATRYIPPAFFNTDGTQNTTTYPSMDGTTTARGADSSSKPNWKAVPNDGYGVQSTGTTNLTNNAWTHVLVAGEYCSSSTLRNCQTGSSGNYLYPAPLRWCNSTALTTCKGTWDATYRYPRAPAPRTATITVNSGTSTTVSGITVGGLQILSATTAGSNNTSTVAGYIVANINACTNSKAGNCATVGYSAYQNNNVVTILAPDNTSATPAVSKGNSGTISFTTVAFDRQPIPLWPWRNGASTSSAAVPGENLRHTIALPNTTTYPKASGRTDCTTTAGVCTYNEEMTNYANWWAYYRTRMQMMKTAASLAFASVEKAEDIANDVSRFRVGYLSINNNRNDFVNLDEFKTSQKNAWYTKLFAAYPNNSTPLRTALSTAGSLYGGVLNGTNLNGTTVIDPLQYSCQQNYTILSTDGFWNTGEGFKLDGSTAVGNQDGLLPRPYNDGGLSQTQKRTSNLQQRSAYQYADKGILQKQVSQLQSQSLTGLQKRTSSNYGASWSGWSNAGSSCTPVSSGKNQVQCRYGSSGAWTNAASCTVVPADPSGTWPASGTACRNSISSAYANATACAVTTTPDATGTTTQCRYNWGASAISATCAPVQADANDFTNATVYRNCTTGSFGSWGNVSSCTPTTTPDASGKLTQCQYSMWTNWASAASCAAIPQSTDSPYTVAQAVECQFVTQSGTGNSDTLADVAAYYYNTDLRRPAAETTSTPADTTGPCRGPNIGPYSDTYQNNLCSNNVPTFGLDTSSTQHMTTFTLGLGAQGKMVYSDYQNNASGTRTYVPDYWQQATGDFYDIKSGTTPNATNGICSWMASGNCTWPTPSASSTANIDDLWHAAVNGRGKYFSATDPVSLTSSLVATLDQISLVPRPGAAAAAASSNPNISTSDNFVFSSSYRSVDWYGELIRQQIDENGVLSAQQWSAMQALDCATTPWAPNKAYAANDAFNYGGACYKVTNAFTSGATFNAASTDIARIVPECSSWPDWLANTPYAGGDTFKVGGTCYRADTAFTSGATFSTANVTAVAITPITRTIYTSDGNTTPARIPFLWGSLSAAQQAYFKKANIAYNPTSTTTNADGLSQFCTAGATCLTTSQQDSFTIATNGAAGEALVNFLRGDRSNEGTFYRQRVHVLGDIVSSEARYVKAPLFNYTDPGYDAFKALHASRAGTVYVAANDGMLHAFDAVTGQENWAFVPSAVLSRIYKLADKNYATMHKFLVDGSPEIGEICPTAPTTGCDATQWRTILVGGLNDGGKAYYALDITNPASPTLLWEFTNANLGYTYGNPRITKLKNGKWVVMFASGYNNSNGTDSTAGDGVGRLFIVAAATGTALTGTGAPPLSISTGVGSYATPSGLAKIAAHVPAPMVDNTVQAVYGGDLLGNLWRFDVNGDIGSTGIEAHRLVSFTDDPAGNNPQPITAKPVVTTVEGKPVIYIGTGRYLGVPDVASTQTQSFYAVKDDLTGNSLLSPRANNSGFVLQTLTSATCPNGAPANVCTSGQTVRTTTSNTVTWTSQNGWFFDFVTSGERSTTDAALGLGVLMFTTITPNLTSDGPCGVESTDTSSSYLYAVNYLDGSAVTGAYGVGGVSLGLGLATRPVMIRQADGSVRGLIRVSSGSAGSGTDGGKTVIYTPNLPASTGSSRRVSWRELNGE